MKFFTQQNGWMGLKLVVLVGLFAIATELIASSLSISWVSRFWGFIFEDTPIPIIFFVIALFLIAFGKKEKDQSKETQV